MLPVMNIIKIEPDSKVRTQLVVDPSCGHVVHICGATPPFGERFLLTDSENVEIYHEANCVGRFPLLAFEDLEIHPDKDILIGTNGAPGCIRVLSFSGEELNRIVVPSGSEYDYAGFDVSGSMFYVGDCVERVQLGCVPDMQMDILSDISIEPSRFPLNSSHLGQPQGSGWRYWEICVGYSIQLFRCGSSGWQWGDSIQGIRHNIAFSPDGLEYVTTEYDDRIGSLGFRKVDLRRPESVVGSTDCLRTDQPTERSFYIDLVRAIFLTYDGRIFILHTRSMTVEAELQINGVASINQMVRCGGDIMLITVEGDLVFISIAKVCAEI